jgi:hypothetical protein
VVLFEKQDFCFDPYAEPTITYLESQNEKNLLIYIKGGESDQALVEWKNVHKED